MKREPIAYLRKSRVTNDRHLSWEMQESAIREMAGEDVALLSDWNKSGGTSARPGYQALIAAIEAGTVSTVYSYSLSRLSRSLSDFSALVELCEKHGVAIRLHSERHLDFDTASGRLMVNILAAFAQMERELARERARDTIAVRRARGDKIGPAHFDKPELVIAAFRQAGSIAGAAVLLREQGVPTRNGKAHWSPTAVRTIIARVAPAELPRVKERGVKKAAPFTFYRLLRCPTCGRTLTGVRYVVKGREYATYRCLGGRFAMPHPHQSVPERAVLDWAREELALLDVDAAVATGGEDEERRNALRERRERLGRAFVDGLVSEADYEKERAHIASEEDRLESTGRVVALPRVDINLEADPLVVNEVLRALWDHVELGQDFRPVRAHRLDDRLWRQRAG